MSVWDIAGRAPRTSNARMSDATNRSIRRGRGAPTTTRRLQAEARAGAVGTVELAVGVVEWALMHAKRVGLAPEALVHEDLAVAALRAVRGALSTGEVGG